MNERRSYYNPKCEYAENCTDKGRKCEHCRNNKKRSYYVPARRPFISPTISPSGPFGPYRVTCNDYLGRFDDGN